LGVNENKLLNLDSKPNKNLGWSLSYGLAYSYTDYFYVTNYDKSYQLDKLKDRAAQVVAGAVSKEIKNLTGRLNGLLLGNVHGFSLGSLQTALTQGSLQSISREFAEAISSVRNNEVGELTGREKAYSTSTVNSNLTGTDKAYEQGESPNTQLSGKDKAHTSSTINPAISGNDNVFK
jgi:hypothetical protein